MIKRMLNNMPTTLFTIHYFFKYCTISILCIYFYNLYFSLIMNKIISVLLQTNIYIMSEKYYSIIHLSKWDFLRLDDSFLIISSANYIGVQIESEWTTRQGRGLEGSQVNKFVEVLVSRRPGYGRHSKYAAQIDGGWNALNVQRSDNRNRD